MSTALAIASVTAVLKDLLNNGVVDHDLTTMLGPVTVSALAPDRIKIEENSEPSQLNLFLYQVTPNAAWRNAALPSRDSRGARLTNPPLALDLHYILTAYGEKDLHTEILLGYGMQILHETPVLVRDSIRRALSPLPLEVGSLPPSLQGLFESGLAEQVEQIKIVPQNISTEEISRLWTAFQARYRPSAAYQVSVVLIESRSGAARPALPVRERNIYAVPFRQPVIEQVLSKVNANDPALANKPILHNHHLVLAGHQLRGEDTRVLVGDSEVTPAAADVSESQISFPLPAGLLAGVKGVQVVHYRLMGTPETPHLGVASEVSSFVLRPHLDTPPNVVSGPAPGDASLRKGTVDLTVSPAVGREQRAVLLLNQIDPPPGEAPASYSFERRSPYQVIMPPLVPPPTTGTVLVNFDHVKPGKYLVRLRVDGADSPLETDASNKYNAPFVDIV
ncbi:MAG TPA: DUF4255 domain-containing protein [Pyrinomonadaceae bacterium]|jgi:hypothetical protein|nr:DUF4255 domain-containing protein [Pyrinomonadaceae bacterium]